MTLVFKKCSYAVTSRGLLRDVDIAVERGRVSGIGTGLGGGEEIDCQGLVALPGLANAHTHLSHMYAPPKTPAPTWERHHEDAPQREVAELALRLALIRALESGTTLVADTTAHPDLLQRIAGEVGVKVIPAVPWGTLSGWEGSVVLGSLEEAVEHSEEIRERVASSQQALIFLHVANDRSQLYAAKTKYGRFPIELLDSLGLLTPRTVLVNPGWASSWELRLVGEKGARVVYAPMADALTSSGGMLPVRELASNGVTAGLCSETPLIGQTLDMLDVTRAFLIIQRELFWEKGLTALGAMSIATRGGYSALSVKGGVIEEGSVADMVLVASELARFKGVDPERLLLSLSTANIVYVLVDGKVVLEPSRKEQLEAVKRTTLERLLDRLDPTRL